MLQWKEVKTPKNLPWTGFTYSTIDGEQHPQSMTCSEIFPIDSMILCSLHLQGQRIMQVTNQHEAGGRLCLALNRLHSTISQKVKEVFSSAFSGLYLQPMFFFTPMSVSRLYSVKWYNDWWIINLKQLEWKLSRHFYGSCVESLVT
jgi:hypothetical protein